MKTLTLERTLTELDHVRLTNLVQRQKGGRTVPSAPMPIEDVLDMADVVPSREMAPDIVTMYSRVQLEDVHSGARSELTLCYPADADAGAGFVSVLSPIGWSLLGQRAGSVVRWPSPAGGELAATIVAIVFQPESSGDFAM
ncbi:MAG TPA: GreA/GreB family elongation factor [Burkholderiaceae bacterium]|jgi:regulator of nucleoside diphosphate kinase|nr:GreA/GreB family elongation factor [Burkholderiaceae bacterium]